jgi:carboxypeptidase D
MLSANDTVYSNLIGTLGYAPTLTWVAVFQLIPSVPFIDHWANIFNLNASFVASMHNASDACGHTQWMNDHLTYPPPEGPFGIPPDGLRFRDGCDTWSAIFDATILVNPCFNVYHITDQCPLLYDPLGFPSSFLYTPPGASIYFNRSDVQAAINAPSQPWSLCVDDVLNTDTSEWSGFADAGKTPVFPRVIERSQRTILVGGGLDFDVLANGTLLAIQNMTWNGAQGFQTQPSDPFIVPYDEDPFQQVFCTVDKQDAGCGEADFAAVGELGVTHTERGLTWVEMPTSGHMGPQYQPAAGWRHLQFLLGRIDAF